MQVEVDKVSSQLIVAVVVEAFDGGVLDRSVHVFDLTVRPRMVGLGQPILVLLAIQITLGCI
jgi:hypothetical protein